MYNGSIVPGKLRRPYAGTMEQHSEKPEAVRRQLRRSSLWLAVLFVLAILLFTLSPGGSKTSGASVINAIADIYGTREQASWLLHGALFGLLGVSLSLWFASSSAGHRSPMRTLAMLVLVVWIFAAATEFAQGRIDGRDASVVDWIADMVGVLAGLLLAPMLLRPLFRLLLR